MTEDFSILISSEWLNQHLDSVKVLDCTTHMIPQPVGPSRIESGRPDFERAHIPGAQHVDMVEDLSDPDGEFPYTLPGTAQIETLLSGLGISTDDHIVLYSSTHLMVATRAWYVLRALGHQRVSILNGGLGAWTAASYPVESSADAQHAPAARTDQSSAAGSAGSPAADAGDSSSAGPADSPTVGPGGASALGSAGSSSYRASPDRVRYADRNDVAGAAGSGTIVVNALSAAQHAGTGGAHYGRPGRIPGSVSVPTATLLSPDGTAFAPLEAVRAQFAAQGITPESQVITYCGGGIAATVDAFALELIGHEHWAVYDNSLLEWSANPDNPMETD